MYTYENTPVQWFHPNRRPQSFYYPPPPPPPMSRPVSKSFNRISDFIFPDTVHIQCPPSIPTRYHRTDNYSLPILNRNNIHQRDIVIVERLPAEEVDNVDLLYREQHHQPNRSIRRRYSSIVDERRVPFQNRTSMHVANRSTGYRERIRDRRKRHTTDNVYHSMLKSMLDDDEQMTYSNETNPNYILSYRATLDPITDSESMTSLHEQTNHSRVPINGTIPILHERERTRQRQDSSSMSSRDSSSDTDITQRRPIPVTKNPYQQNLSQNLVSTVWERRQNNSSHQPSRFLPIISSNVDTNNHETMSYSSNNRINSSPFDNVINDQINNPTSSLVHDSTHHVSLCVNDLRTTLFIDEDTLNNSKTNHHGNKAIIKTFVDRIIKHLQHFKCSLDNGLIHVRKRNTLMNGPIISADNEKINIDDSKLIRPYFLIRPQSLLLLPNEIAKFKCCFGGDPHPSLIWSHNDSHISETETSSKYQMHKLHDIHYLDIGPVQLNDNGEIKCAIMNKFGREETVAQLFVVASPANGMPSITQPLNDITMIEGQPLKISCGINGLQVIVHWFHNGKLISPTSQLKSDYHNENSIFTLSNCMRTDAGTIDCLVKNRFGEVRTSCRIEVINDPEFGR